MDELRRLTTGSLAMLSSPWLALGTGRSGLRVLGYHQVSDPSAFERQIAYLVERFQPITPMDLERKPTPRDRPRVWVTFDDGDPSVVENGLPILQKYGVPATLFVCPGVVDSERPHWWQVVEHAASSGVVADGRPVTQATVFEMKRLPNDQRLARLGVIERAIAERAHAPFAVRQLSTDQLDLWIAAGHTVGNHTWDHPLLDHCDEATQREQIGKAHAWLMERIDPEQLLFAYPNGNWTSFAESELTRYGYEAGLLFDHRVSHLGHPLRISRIRVNAHDDLATFKARVSGLHPAIHQGLRRS